jgi:hypothetical protein
MGDPFLALGAKLGRDGMAAGLSPAAAMTTRSSGEGSRVDNITLMGDPFTFTLSGLTLSISLSLTLSFLLQILQQLY